VRPAPDLFHRYQLRAVVIALNLLPFAGIAFLWFIGAVRDRIGQVVPRWIGMLGFAVAVVSLVSVDLTVWVELLFPAWILLLSVDIRRIGLRQSPGAVELPIGAKA
jgi:hypothetical protein